MKAYKGFNSDLTCRDFQYKEGETFTLDGKAKLCKHGFHACTNPIDTLHYYIPAEGSRYFEVECDGVSQEESEDSKIVCSKITVGAELDLLAMVKIGASMIFDRVKKTNHDKATSGDRSTAATSGDQSTAATSGDQSTAATSGYRSTAATSGDQSTAATSGYRSTAATSGYRSTAATSGNRSTAATSGNRSTAATSGNQSTAIANGKESIAIANGYEVKAKGVVGSYIVLTEYDDNCNLVCVKCHKVDGKTIKPDKFYMLKNGKFVEAKG